MSGFTIPVTWERTKSRKFIALDSAPCFLVFLMVEALTDSIRWRYRLWKPSLKQAGKKNNNDAGESEQKRFKKRGRG